MNPGLLSSLWNNKKIFWLVFGGSCKLLKTVWPNTMIATDKPKNWLATSIVLVAQATVRDLNPRQ
ncbi:hypothetical protein F444_14852 [Phytophthora nicotianae P1976]|uniref:Uncharacterized protein n=1 Tax=Phytophthora nicotianae P1976 TaxID=1317066 RepID=A0A080ZNT6_PHYNI|nr:hypothetical protein F444_14852 [Phytophthora nicotianae P1976]